MKCINCGTDNTLKDRTANQGRCTKCNHPFAFEPTSMGTIQITDPMFAKLINDISANNCCKHQIISPYSSFDVSLSVRIIIVSLLNGQLSASF